MDTRRPAQLRPHNANPRGPVSDTDPGIAELAASIREVGLLQPIVITPENVVIAGHRRLVAAHLAGVQTVPVIVRNVTPFEQLACMLIENLLRADLTPSQEARGYQRMLAEGGSVASLARRLSVTQTRINERMRVLELDDESRRALDAGEIQIGAVPYLLKISDPDERARTVSDLAERRVTVGQLKFQAKSASIKASIASRGPYEKKASGPCLACADKREQLMAALSALRRAENVIREQLGERYVPQRPAVVAERKAS